MNLDLRRYFDINYGYGQEQGFSLNLGGELVGRKIYLTDMKLQARATKEHLMWEKEDFRVCGGNLVELGKKKRGKKKI